MKIEAVRYEIEMHPDATGKRVPNAWMCRGYNAQGKTVCVQVGGTAKSALAAAIDWPVR